MTDGGVVLAIETSQRHQSVAARAGDGPVVVEPVDASDRSREDLMPAIGRAFYRLGASPDALQAVMLNTGPGGFTGLRIAHATAQAMSLACGARIVTVGAGHCARMASVMAGELPAQDAAWVGLASKGDETWIELVSAGDGGAAAAGRSIEASAWHPLGGAWLISDEHLPDAWRRRVIELGVRLLPLRVEAEAVLRAGEALLARGRHVPPEGAVPVYPREAEAVRLWRQRHAGPAAR